MSNSIRDAPMGQLIRYITRNRVLRYPEEEPGFVCPGCYVHPTHSQESKPQSTASDTDFEKSEEEPELRSPHHDLHLTRTESDRSHQGISKSHTTNSALSKVGSRIALEHAATQADLEKAFSVATQARPSTPEPIEAVHLDDGTILVDWYTTDDPANPQNWSNAKKGAVTGVISLYTTAVYIGSAIYSPSAEGVMEQFGVSAIAASLGIALFVLAYGLGPMVFSPLSEIPSVGRNPPYVITFFIFTIICIPTSLVDNFAGLLVLRFLQGFFGSPILATGGASLQDMFSIVTLPYILCIWAGAACIGPALGPVISGFAVTALNWRWSLYELAILAGPVWFLLFLTLPETYPETILLRRAQRLRKLTGNLNLKAQSEISSASLSVKEVVLDALVRPWKLILLDPAIAYADLYIALCYAIFYSFFEVFPLVYINNYGFNLGEMGLVFISIAIGVVISIPAYYAYLYYIVQPLYLIHGLGAPERRLIPALYSSFLVPIGLFIFAWTSDGNIHWIVSCVGITLTVVGIFILFQCIFVYLPMVYPQYAGSLFAGNDTARSLLAAAAILFSRPMFQGMGIGPGVSLLAALTAICIVGIFVLFLWGDKLRARSRFSAK